MSRIGNKPIEIPAGIDVKVEGNTVTVSGKGITLSQTVDSRIGVKVDGNVMHITRADEGDQEHARPVPCPDPQHGGGYR